MTKRTYKILAVASFFALLLVSARVVLATSETAQDMALNAVSDYLRANPDKEVALRVLAAVEAAQKGGSMIGAYIASPTGLTDLNVTNDLVVDGLTTLTGAASLGSATLTGALVGTSATLSGQLNYLESYEAITASNTITVAESGKTFYLSGATSTQTLPATSTAAGTVYRFFVGGSVTGDITIVTSDGSNAIEGTLIVAGAVVDCDAEDTITIVSDGENVGDFVELRSNGTKWFIGASGALTGSKMTCTAT